MCFLIHLSTTSDLDLAKFNDPALPLRFERITELKVSEGHLVSLHPNKWHLTRWGGCSCHFREGLRDVDGNMSVQELFLPPQDWRVEDADDVEATKRVYDIVRELVERGEQVECVQIWNEFELVCHMEVSLARVPRDHFAFGEDFCFRFVP